MLVYCCLFACKSSHVLSCLSCAKENPLEPNVEGPGDYGVGGVIPEDPPTAEVSSSDEVYI